MNYEQNAIEFAMKNGITLKVIAKEYTQYFGEKDFRWVFKLKLQRNRKSYTFKFGQSIASGSKEPTIYDVLACLEKYEFENFEHFCLELGYNEDSRKSYNIYKAVCKEFKAVERLFGDILEELREIN